jgi:hypothetical protein
MRWRKPGVGDKLYSAQSIDSPLAAFSSRITCARSLGEEKQATFPMSAGNRETIYPNWVPCNTYFIHPTYVSSSHNMC